MATIDMSLYTSTQDALNNNVRDAVNGDTFVYPDGWSETISATLDFTHFGDWTGAEPPTIFYSAPNNTANFDINTTMFNSGAAGGGGGGFIIDGWSGTCQSALYYSSTSYYNQAIVQNCSFDGLNNGNSTITNGWSCVWVRNCYFKNFKRLFRGGSSGQFSCEDCVIDACTLYPNDTKVHFFNCLFLNGAKAAEYGDGRYITWIKNCTFLGNGSGTAIQTYDINVSDCIFKDWSVGIDNLRSQYWSVCKNNSFYNCTTDMQGTWLEDYGNETLTSDPFPTPGVYVPEDVGSIYSDVNIGEGTNEYARINYRGAFGKVGSAASLFRRSNMRGGY